MSNRLSDQVAHAIGDPGTITPRKDNGEGLVRWQARAVLTVLVRGRYLDEHPGHLNPATFVLVGVLMFVLGLAAGGWVL